MKYEIREVQVKRTDPLYPRAVFRILKRGIRLIPSRAEGNHYIWQIYEEFLMSSYLSRRAAEKMLDRRIAREKADRIRGLRANLYIADDFSVDDAIVAGGVENFGKYLIQDEEELKELTEKTEKFQQENQ